MDISQQKFEELVKKIEEAKKSGSFDLSTEEDLAVAIMNLISLEEHFFFTNARTNKPEYLDLLNETREMRKELLAKLIDKHEGETWCISKHLLAASMRLIEVGTKLQSDAKKAEPRSERSSATGDEAQKIFNYSYKLFSLFWGLRLKLINVSDIKEMAKTEDKPWTLQDIVNKLVDCCEE